MKDSRCCLSSDETEGNPDYSVQQNWPISTEMLKCNISAQNVYIYIYKLEIVNIQSLDNILTELISISTMIQNTDILLKKVWHGKD